MKGNSAGVTWYDSSINTCQMPESDGGLPVPTLNQLFSKFVCFYCVAVI